jgi:hypothetical protein
MDGYLKEVNIELEGAIIEICNMTQTPLLSL